MNKITFIAVVAGKDDIDRFLELTLYSILKNFNNTDIEEFLIITREQDIDYFQNELNKNNYNKDNNNQIKIINEKKVFNKRVYSNYQLQIILKLYISYYVKTELYITLDSDMYLTKKISINDIIVDNKPIVNFEKIKYHIDWHNSSKKLLNIDFNENDDCIGVTPSILYTNFVKQLLKEYEKDILSFPKLFTEYSLYSLFITHKYNISLDKLYYRKNLYNNCIWKKLDNKFDITIYTNKIKEQFNEKETIFSIIQSNLVRLRDISKDDYNNIIKYIINNIK